jgi:hypothetical protein
MANPIMNAKDAVYGGLASCFVTINGRRLNFLNLKEFESKQSITLKDIQVLGTLSTQHKAAGGKGTWTATAHLNQSHFRAVAAEYQRTGVMPYFDIQTTNDDPTSAVGRQTIIHHDCLFGEVILSKIKAGEEVLEESLSGTFNSWTIPEMFKELDGI